MISNRSIPNVVVIPELAYRNVSEAAAWLCAAFGFRERLRIANHRIQLSVGSSGAVVAIEFESATDQPADRAHAVLVRSEDVDQHHARAKAFGARIIRSPESYPFGERQYTVEDIGGHVWTFSQSIADVDPASWGGITVSDPNGT